MTPLDIYTRFSSLLHPGELNFPEGWDTLLANCLATAEQILIDEGIPAQEWPKALPSEKLGRLRVFFSRTQHAKVDQRLFELSEATMNGSARVCIFCGALGQMRAKGWEPPAWRLEEWMHPSCDACEALYQAKLKANH